MACKVGAQILARQLAPQRVAFQAEREHRLRVGRVEPDGEDNDLGGWANSAAQLGQQRHGAGPLHCPGAEDNGRLVLARQVAGARRARRLADENYVRPLARGQPQVSPAEVGRVDEQEFSL
jgi:hypothetical protein